ncbi:hypothetical protein Cni_G10193 [Canna indica]|uniref:Uncharacterized protein n=1 Tax=Canna indica TaxID=4628 RepID=A0AAQ3K3X4_9LILI|nr:hypothetical protein Cni_G10193 [Canna indica]
MDSSTDLITKSLLFLHLLVLSAAGCYPSIFSFGDSLADTGNLLSTSPNDQSGCPPYGMTFFHHPTGRCSDGRLIVDFIAEAMGLPLLPPFLEIMNSSSAQEVEELRKGVNFAVSGATAMDYSFFKERGVDVSDNNSSLFYQLQWFKQLLPSLCSSSSDCKKMLQNSLFLLGEIGGNDYNNPFTQGLSVDEIRSFVPRVIQTIGSAINELIELGARTLVVPGITPLGCNSMYMTYYHSDNQEDYYDSRGCINWLNEFASYHNGLVQDEIRRLRQLHPYATLIYADYYGAIINIFSNPQQFGFGNKELFVACCGGGGPYNYNASAICGYEGSTVCDDPSKYFHWDGLHCTEAAYRIIADGLLTGYFATSAISSSCPGVKLNADQLNLITSS